MGISSAHHRRRKSWRTRFSCSRLPTWLSRERERARDIVLVIFLWIGGGFSDRGRSSKMQYRVDLMRAKRCGNRGRVFDVGFDQWTPADKAIMPGGQIIYDDRKITCSAQGLAGMCADIASAASDEDHAKAQPSPPNVLPLMFSDAGRVVTS